VSGRYPEHNANERVPESEENDRTEIGFEACHEWRRGAYEFAAYVLPIIFRNSALVPTRPCIGTCLSTSSFSWRMFW
jgi:hypothetical protein